MVAQGIFVAVEAVPGIAHNKVMMIDDNQVLTGSLQLYTLSLQVFFLGRLLIKII